MDRAAAPDLDQYRPERFSDIEGDGDDHVAGYVLVRPVSHQQREFWCADLGRWLRWGVSWEAGVTRTVCPDRTTVYGDEDTAREQLRARVAEDGVITYLAAVPKAAELEQRLETDRGFRRL
jgi:hypothetical protein